MVRVRGTVAWRERSRSPRATSDPSRSVTANLCASSPSTAAILATDGPSASRPSFVSSCTVMYFTNESSETPLYMREYPYVGSTWLVPLA